MRIKSAVIASGLAMLGAVLVSLTNNGCGDDDENQVRLARKGEACQTTNDCSPGLACVPSSAADTGICVLGIFSVPQTAKECAVIECTQASDCCGPPPSFCPQLLVTCLEDAGSTSQQACIQYEAACKCDTTRRDCENSKCVTKCQNNDECTRSGAGRVCAGGKCVSCAADTDCGMSGGTQLKCVSGKCQPPCQGDGDCPGFERCMNGQCTQGACLTNRECVAATRNVEATCGTDGKCIVPCQTDLECGNPKSYRFFSCVQGQCLYLGCESDKDCRLLIESSIGSSSSGGSSGGSSGITSSSGGSSGGSSGSSGGAFTPQQHIVCRDKQSPSASTIPAQ